MKKISVFIVEDSLLMQKILQDILSNDPDITIVGRTKYGKEALRSIAELRPDVVTLDVNLPDVDGLEVLKELMARNPTRVVMFSAYTQQGAAVTMKALELGALDFIPKPSGEISLDLYNFQEEIISKIRMVADINIGEGRAVPAPAKGTTVIKNLVVIGASTGGPKAIMDVMSAMPADLDAAFLIVQHMPQGFTKSFAERISWHSGVRTKEAEDGDILRNGSAYVAPAGYHVVIEKVPEKNDEYVLRLDDTSLVNYVRPAADVTMSSAAEVFSGEKKIGVILTGMGKDGFVGSSTLKRQGGYIIAQDEASCVVYGMPRLVVDNKIADKVLPLDQIANTIILYLKNGK